MSMQPSTVPRAATIHEVSAALRRGDVQGAESLFTAGAPAPASIVAAADSAMRDRRYAEAGWLFDRVPDRDLPTGIKRCLCRNLACLQQHRPDDLRSAGFAAQERSLRHRHIRQRTSHHRLPSEWAERRAFPRQSGVGGAGRRDETIQTGAGFRTCHWPCAASATDTFCANSRTCRRRCSWTRSKAFTCSSLMPTSF